MPYDHFKTALENMHRDLLEVGTLAVLKPTGTLYTLLQPELSRDPEIVTLRIPTHWDVQTAVQPEAPGYPATVFRPEGRAWLEVYITAGEFGLNVRNNGELSFFQDAREIHSTAHAIHLVHWYSKLRQRILRYVYLPGIPSDYEEPQSFMVVTHPEALTPTPGWKNSWRPENHIASPFTR